MSEVTAEIPDAPVRRRPKPRVPVFTADQVVEALKKSHGIKTNAAKRLGCERHTIDHYAKRYPTVQAACDEAREGIVDLGESALVSALKRQEAWAVSLTLRSIGRDRGYGDVSEQRHSGPDGGPLQVHVTYDDIEPLGKEQPA